MRICHSDMHVIMTKSQIQAYLRKKRVHCLQISPAIIFKIFNYQNFFETTK